jgi:hypothetical protein
MPHDSGGVHEPQSSVPPQVSAASPHAAPSSAHVTGVQPHWFMTPPPPHSSGATQLPHSSTCEHPSDTFPQPAPREAQEAGVHEPGPHWLGPAAPHVSPLGHVPHCRTASQPSSISPQSAPAATHVVLRQPHTCSMPSPPQGAVRHRLRGAEPPIRQQTHHCTFSINDGARVGYGWPSPDGPELRTALSTSAKRRYQLRGRRIRIHLATRHGLHGGFDVRRHLFCGAVEQAVA